jgi:hypothetical protein
MKAPPDYWMHRLRRLRMAGRVAWVGVRGVRGKLRGARTERRWQRLYVLALHQRSQPAACASQATMAWKRSWVRVPQSSTRFSPSQDRISSVSFQRSVWFSLDAGAEWGARWFLVRPEDVVHCLRAASLAPGRNSLRYTFSVVRVFAWPTARRNCAASACVGARGRNG